MTSFSNCRANNLHFLHAGNTKTGFGLNELAYVFAHDDDTVANCHTDVDVVRTPSIQMMMIDHNGDATPINEEARTMHKRRLT